MTAFYHVFVSESVLIRLVVPDPHSEFGSGASPKRALILKNIHGKILEIFFDHFY